MSGSAISMIEALTVAISTPSVVFDSAIHLYRGPGGWAARPAPRCRIPRVGAPCWLFGS
jgi:hypothetical protein